MNFRPPDKSKAYFLDILDHLLKAGPPSHVWLADSLACPDHPDDPYPKIHATPRFSIMLEGRFPFTISQQGQRRDIDWKPGEAIYFARNAWSLEYPREPCLFFGAVLLPGRVRFILVDRTDVHNIISPTPWFYHTAHPIPEAGIHATWALDALAGQGESAAALPLLHALLHLVREHLQRDELSHDEYSGRALNTWQHMQDYLHENYTHPISRTSVARALKLHPNYLSALCMREGGASFHQTLETIRVERAQHLLRSTDLNLERIAVLCGFSGRVHFARAFHRSTGMIPSAYRNKHQNLRLASQFGPRQES